MAEPGSGILTSNRAERRRDGLLECIASAGTRRPQRGFELAEGQFNRVEIRRVGREEAQPGTGRLDGPVGTPVVPSLACEHSGCRR